MWLHGILINQNRVVERVAIGVTPMGSCSKAAINSSGRGNLHDWNMHADTP